MSPVHATCQISIRGAFDVHWEDYLGEMLLHAEVTAGQVRTTTLFGEIPDLAAFVGALDLLQNLGFPVIGCEFRRVNLEE